MKYLFDTNVIIDALTSRNNISVYSQQLLKEVASNKIKAYLSCKQMTDISYILRKYYSQDDIKEILGYLLEMFELLPILPSDIKIAQSLKISDFEDAVIYETAKTNMISCIITNNVKDFNNAKIGIMTPKELITVLNNK